MFHFMRFFIFGCASSRRHNTTLCRQPAAVKDLEVEIQMKGLPNMYSADKDIRIDIQVRELVIMCNIK